MRFLHIADLHIGRRLGGISLAEDQRHALSQIVDLAGGADAVLIAGDFYNRAQPGGEALRIGGEFLSALSALGKPVFMIAGNHDGAELVDYCGGILSAGGIHVAGAYDGQTPRHVLRDAYGEVHVYLLPFVKPIHVRAALGRDDISGYEDAVRAALDRIELDPAARSVLVAHQFVSGAETSESEERAIGGLDEVSAALFERFDYVALGHLHSPQRLSGGRVCYSGSPLKYALGEARQRKGVMWVELGPKGSVGVESVPLAPLRDVRSVEGSLLDIAAPENYSEDFIGAVVTDELPPPDPLGALRTVYPNLIAMALRNSRTNVEYEFDAADIELEAQKDALEHFIDFYTRQNNQVPPDERRVAVMREIIESVKEREHAAD